MAAPEIHAVILAGGRGTRFWPRSRRGNPKQLLPVAGPASMLQRTVARLDGLVPPERVWVLTGEHLRARIRRQLPGVPAEQIVAEPEGRNTAPAIALAATLIARRNPAAVMAVLPADHLIAGEKAYRAIFERAAKAATRKRLVVLGIQPRHPETGYGYIEFAPGTAPGGRAARPVVAFREKPEKDAAAEFVAAGNFYWNSGQFFWRADTILDAFARWQPETHAALDALPALDSRAFRRALAEAYPRCLKISIDYGILEYAAGLIDGFPCRDFGWSDVGDWNAVYEIAQKDSNGNASDTAVELLEATGNFIDAPGKLVALVGVHDLIVVDTADALLICPRSEAQKVSAMVEALEKSGWNSLL